VAGVNKAQQKKLRQLQIQRRVVMTPEGLPLVLTLAGKDIRLAAFLMDLFLMTLFILIFSTFLYNFFELTSLITITIAEFGIFLITQFYFIYFELAWQGRTPGKKCYNLRVVNRRGGELTPAAIVARNLTREVEIFLPLSLFFQSLFSVVLFNDGTTVASLFWALTLSALPLFSKAMLRAGDFLAGTMVVVMPQRVLLTDLFQTAKADEEPPSFTFSPSQLSVYDFKQLVVLEDILRKVSDLPKISQSHYNKALAAVCRKICQKIGYRQSVPPTEERGFLTDFYKAQRAVLERALIYGQRREIQNNLPLAPPPNTPIVPKNLMGKNS
jgi:uncharacterized RDD family membrane protein YckC